MQKDVLHPRMKPSIAFIVPRQRSKPGQSGNRGNNTDKKRISTRMTAAPILFRVQEIHGNRDRSVVIIVSMTDHSKPSGPALSESNRRQFLKTSSIATAAGIMAPIASRGQDQGTKLKVGLIGCGGRGSGAANQALTADSNTELWAMGDVFESSINRSLKGLTAAKESQVNVPEERRFLGLDAIDKVLATGVDVAILATPPGFRPEHLRKAIDAGKHVFCEKPVAVDAPGVRSVLESARVAREKKLNIVCGFCWRYEFARREAFGMIHDGAIGDVRSVYATYHTGPVKPMPDASARREGESDVEWQVRNWYNFSWLSGDSLVEQAIHSVDKIAWAMNDIDPIAAVAVGGRQIPAKGGNIFDHFHVVYQYPR